MSYTMQDLLFGVGGSAANIIGGMAGKLGNRQDLLINGGLQKLADAILELSRNYRFQGLEETGPVVPLEAGVYQYPVAFFTNAGAQIVNLIPSFYVNYYNYGYSQAIPNYQGGTGLKWKSIDALELMLNVVPSNPAYFTRYGGQFIIAPVPYATNTAYLRYQIEHPFSTPVSLFDPFLLDNEWREIAEYAGALRFATDTRMLDYASNYQQMLYGDPNKRNDVGLIKARITQIEGDSTSNTSMRSIRVVINKH